MSNAILTLLFKAVTALPLKPRIWVCRLLLFFYLLSQKRYLKEISNNYQKIFQKKDFFFFFRSLWRMGENLAITLTTNPKELKKIIDRIEISGDNIIEEGEEGKKGIIVLTLHYGIYEILPLFFSQKGHKVAIAVASQLNPAIEELLAKLRLNRQVKICKKIAEMVEYLKKGYLLGFAVDNSKVTKRVELPQVFPKFKILKTPLILAKRLNLPLALIFVAKKKSFKWQVMVEKIKDLADLGERMRHYIFKNPEEWVFFGKDAV